MEQAQAIDWVKPPSKALDDSKAPLYQWFTDAEVNTCYNAVDRHVENGRADQAAIIYDSPTARVLARSIPSSLAALPQTSLRYALTTPHRKRLSRPLAG